MTGRRLKGRNYKELLKMVRKRQPNRKTGKRYEQEIHRGKIFTAKRKSANLDPTKMQFLKCYYRDE